jgi:hypothetical protein
MKLTLVHLLLAAVVGYVVYTYVIGRESMTNTQDVVTAVGVVVGIAVVGGLAMYATSK